MIVAGSKLIIKTWDLGRATSDQRSISSKRKSWPGPYLMGHEIAPEKHFEVRDEADHDYYRWVRQRKRREEENSTPDHPQQYPKWSLYQQHFGSRTIKSGDIQKKVRASEREKLSEVERMSGGTAVGSLAFDMAKLITIIYRQMWARPRLKTDNSIFGAR